MVDTPGIFDLNGADKENAMNLVKHLRGCGGANTFVVICKPTRLDYTFQGMLAKLNILLGVR